VRETQAGMHFDVGATRRDRTGDLLITKFLVPPYAIESEIGLTLETLAYSVWRALIESDFESKFVGDPIRQSRCPPPSARGRKGRARAPRDKLASYHHDPVSIVYRAMGRLIRRRVPCANGP
jgi:hypothetical protein